MLKEIYKETNNFYYLKVWLRKSTFQNCLFFLLIINVPIFFFAIVSQFQLIPTIMCVVIFLFTVVIGLYFFFHDIYYENKANQYETTVSKVLEKWNDKFSEKGVKFSILRKYFVLVIHADFRKEGYTYNLHNGKLIRDNEGKLIRQKKKEIKKPNIANTSQPSRGNPQHTQQLNQVNQDQNNINNNNSTVIQPPQQRQQQLGVLRDTNSTNINPLSGTNTVIGDPNYKRKNDLSSLKYTTMNNTMVV